MEPCSWNDCMTPSKKTIPSINTLLVKTFSSEYVYGINCINLQDGTRVKTTIFVSFDLNKQLLWEQANLKLRS